MTLGTELYKSQLNEVQFSMGHSLYQEIYIIYMLHTIVNNKI